MSEKIKDGGAAFPSGIEEVKYPKNGGAITLTTIQPANKGMTLRDYFAAKAMEAMIIGNSASIAVCSRPGAIGVSKDAYIFADAMLAERERGE